MIHGIENLLSVCLLVLTFLPSFTEALFASPLVCDIADLEKVNKIVDRNPMVVILMLHTDIVVFNREKSNKMEKGKTTDCLQSLVQNQFCSCHSISLQN